MAHAFSLGAETCGSLWVWDQHILLNEFQDSQKNLYSEKFIFSYKVNNIENDLFKCDISSCDVTCNADSKWWQRAVHATQFTVTETP